MSDAPLRLLDPDALDRKTEPRGRASIVVPTAWLREGARLSVALPQRLRCDLCDGGGCDACLRSGGYRADEPRAPLEITLPRVIDDHVALRITNPFGDRLPPLLVVHVAAGIDPSAGVTWIGENHDQPPKATGLAAQLPQVPQWARLVSVAVVAAIAALIARLSGC